MRRRMTAWVCASLLSCVSPASHAAPFFVAGDAAARGDPVQVALIDQNTDQFEAATIAISFDPAYLLFTGAALGALIDDAALAFSLVLDDTGKAGGSVVISIAGGAAPVDMSSGELLRVSFEILASAPFGDTQVAFECQNPTATGADSCTTDYLLPPTTFAVTVLSDGARVPAPSSLLLLSLGLAALLARARCGPKQGTAS